MPASDGDIGARIEALLSDLADRDAPAAATGEELVRLLVGYYGEGLERVAGIVGSRHPDLMFELAGDLVESQLILHGLHPLTVDERIESALDRVRPYLGSHAGGVAYLGVDEGGVARLRLDGSCSGCPSSTVTVRTTIEDAVLSAAPELTGIEVEGQVDKPRPLLQIGLRSGSSRPDPEPEHGPEPLAAVWLHPSALELPVEGHVTAARLDGRQVMLARRSGQLYAYTDSCPACGGSLVDSILTGDVLECANCSVRYDIRLAGKALDGTGRYLDPLPLLDDVSGIRIALVPEVVS